MQFLLVSFDRMYILKCYHVLTNTCFNSQVSVGARMYPRDVVIHSGQHLNFTIIGDRMFTEAIFLLVVVVIIF